MDKYIGRLLDNRYEILEVIGTGGMAVVYKARCHRLNRLVAIKILKDDYLQDEDFRRRFHVESQAVAMLSHPNIVSVYDVSTSIMADYIVMELIEGITLKQYMEKKGTLNWKETLHFAIQIAKALEHAHGRGIVHRDIKPHNVMVLKNGSVKVTDFGIARMMSKGNTLTKEALGSVHYISPEQAKGGRVHSRSDIYSLGVVMYEMMSGRPPYDGESPVAVAIQHINGGAVMPSVLNPNIPGGLEQIIMKAMAHELEDRYESATQMLRDMDEFRKDPAMLFDYNTPPLDAVTRLPKPPLVFPDRKPTTAERVAGTGENRRRAAGAAAHSLDSRQAAERAKAEKRRQREQEAEENRSRVATIAIIICSLVAVIAIGVFLAILLGGGMGAEEELVEVPHLEGQLYDSLPPMTDFQVREHDRIYNAEVPAGQIISQKPAAGSKVVKGTTITVYVSLGAAPAPVTMPDLLNVTQQKAEEMLNLLSLDIKVTTASEHSELYEAGQVIRTEPGKNVELVAGQTVTLVISLGEEIKSGYMPNVVNQSEVIAKNILESQSLKLVITVEEVFDSGVAAGYVVRTDPEKNAELKTGMAVKLFVSKGPDLRKMPNVEGMNIDAAVKVITAAGFGTPEIELVYSDKPKNTVITQSVEKNTQVDVNTVIALRVSDGPEPTEATTEPVVVRDVEIDLRGYARELPCQVVISRGEGNVYSETVSAGTESVVLSNQSGSGGEDYSVSIYRDGLEIIAWTQTEVFE